MEWDRIKGFFRRQTQLVNQNYRHTAEPTVDSDYENLVTIVDGLKGLAARSSERTKRLAVAVDTSIYLVHEASLDPPPEQFVWDDMKKLNTKLAAAAQALTPHSGYAKKVLMDHAIQLDRFVSDVIALDQLKEERRASLLEFDFFRNKTAQLRANPPSDPQRIPRNEGRVMEFQQKYESINSKLKQALTGLMSTGERLCAHAHQLMANELNRFAEESSRAWKAANVVAEKGLPMPTQLVNAAISSGIAGAAVAVASNINNTTNAILNVPTNTNSSRVKNPNSGQQNNNVPSQQQQQGGLPSDDTKNWNQNQSSFNFYNQSYQQQPAPPQQQQPQPVLQAPPQQDSLNNTTNLDSTLNGTMNQQRPPSVVQPKERTRNTAVDDPFRM
jgi:hypothetical protein